MMRRSALQAVLAIVLILALALPGCARAGSSLNGSGNILDQDLKVTDFTSINVKGAFEVNISQASEYKAILSTDENLISRVQVSIEHKVLKLSIEAPATFFPTSLKLKVEMPEIVGLNLSEGAKGLLISHKSKEDFALFLDGGSTLNGALDAGTATFNLSGASQATLTGTAMKLVMTCSGKSKAELGDLVASFAQVKIQEASEATLNVQGRFDANLSDASKVYYLGNPLFSNTSITGDSTMIHK
jgi:hypothetical protein